MNYSHTVKARFLDRPNRFVAHVELDGQTETVHVKNTGRSVSYTHLSGDYFMLCNTESKNKRKEWKKLCAMYSFILEYVDTRMPVLECIWIIKSDCYCKFASGTLSICVLSVHIFAGIFMGVMLSCKHWIYEIYFCYLFRSFWRTQFWRLFLLSQKSYIWRNHILADNIGQYFSNW